MEKKEKRLLISGVSLATVFMIWTITVKTVDVQPVGPNRSNIGFATFNLWFHKLTGVHMEFYTATDWLGLIPVFVCVMFAAIGTIQLVRRKNLFKVDRDIVFLGVYYALVISGYLIFEMVPVNYRPVLIEGYLEASYPSSTTLLVLSVMPTLAFQAERRLKSGKAKKIIAFGTAAFSVFMVAGRLISGVHWCTDIIGSVLLSLGIFLIYKAAVLIYCKEEK